MRIVPRISGRWRYISSSRYLKGGEGLILVLEVSNRSTNLNILQNFIHENFFDIKKRDIVVMKTMRGNQQGGELLLPIALDLYSQQLPVPLDLEK